MIRLLQSLIICITLTSCASEPPQQPSPPPAPAPTLIDLQIDTDDNLNRDSTEKSTPVLFRIYELRDPSNFNSADFFALMEKEQATLLNTLINKQEFLLKVGDSKKILLNPTNDVHAIGFFAAFRQLDSAQWRMSSEIISNQTQTIHLKIKNNRIEKVVE